MPLSSSVLLFVLIKPVKTSFQKGLSIFHYFLISPAYFVSTSVNFSMLTYLSQCMRFPTMWYVRLAKPQISLRIRAAWSEPLLIAWAFYDYKATNWTPFGVLKLNRRLQRLFWVYTCQNVTLLEISCTGSFENVTLPLAVVCNKSSDPYHF